MPSPPASCDYSVNASAALSQMYGNDTLGDCVIAGIGHLIGTFTGNAGVAPFIFAPEQIISLYSAIGGYVPGDPSTDQGCDEVTALNHWQNKGAPIGHHKLAGWIQVDGSNPEEYRTALWLFENLFFGMELPDEWVSPFPSAPGFIWDAAGPPDIANGHCVVGVGYGASGVTIDSWGMLGTLTDAAVDKYAVPVSAGALYTVLSSNSLAAATLKAPNGFDWSQLAADFASMSAD